MARRCMLGGVPDSDEVDLNQVVAYNVKAARELRGWTQEELADRLEPYLGQRLTQAGVSSIERAWDSDRRREFDEYLLRRSGARMLEGFALTSLERSDGGLIANGSVRARLVVGAAATKS